MKGGEKQCGKVDKLKPIIAIISLQFGYAGMYIITMVSFKHGMNHWVLATYRHVVATIVMAPFALILESDAKQISLPIKKYVKDMALEVFDQRNRMCDGF
ncbi:hypothetical protein F2Q69_00042281 [Brassica cretica]|uniref:WAT1-related protein n=1 Tax=Brassica cretica TaxID=69181 RepID=A0A8S9N9S5_BRACR|nr:hypothetical protein F2Q69_00042281 [Brassica cretica]